MKLLSQVFVLVVMSLVATQSFAEMYLNVTGTQVKLKSSAGKVKPVAATLKFGYRFSESMSLEGQYGTNASDDDFGGGKVEIDKLSAIFLRIGGQSTYNGVRSYLLIGKSETEVKYTNVATPGASKLEGTAWGIGLEEYSESVKNMAYVLEYVEYADDKGTDVIGFTLGVRYNF